MTLNLPPEIERRLVEAAEGSGMTADAFAVELLNQHLPQSDRREEFLALLQSWMDADDVDEQRETGEFLIRALDEDRLSDRKLFPADMKGITW